ncbi:MAG TPA: DUF6350 family protein [Pseudonocardia sp.]|nr:DUF6350 family protein [Pseudonocardia sp.]
MPVDPADIDPSAAAPVAEPPAAAPDRAPMQNSGDRLRLLTGAAVLSVLLSYLAMALVAALAGLTAGAGPAIRALLVAAIPLWLAAHQVPLVVAGAPLGVLPLVPTAAVLVLAAVLATRATRRLGGRLREDASAVVATLAGAHASVAVLATALPQSPVQAAPWAALLGGGVVAAAGAGLGALRCTGLPAWWFAAPGWARGGIAAARVGAAALATGGALMLLAALLVAVGEVSARFQSAAPGPGAGLGIALLSLCYLPNALIASVSWLAGPGLSIGAAAASPLFTAPGPLPPVPLMAAMPALTPPGWTVVVFLLPVLAGVLVGRQCRQADPEPVRRLWAVAVAAVTIAVGFGLLAAIVSGRLAAGPFDPVDLPALALAGSLLGWIAVPAVAVALLPERARRSRLPGLRRSARRAGAGASAAAAAGGGSVAAGERTLDEPRGGDAEYGDYDDGDDETGYDETGYDETEYDEADYDEADYDEADEAGDDEAGDDEAGNDEAGNDEAGDEADYDERADDPEYDDPEYDDTELAEPDDHRLENTDAGELDHIREGEPTHAGRVQHDRSETGYDKSEFAELDFFDDDLDAELDSYLDTGEADLGEAGTGGFSAGPMGAESAVTGPDQGGSGRTKRAGHDLEDLEDTDADVDRDAPAGTPASARRRTPRADGRAASRWWRRRR